MSLNLKCSVGDPRGDAIRYLKVRDAVLSEFATQPGFKLTRSSVRRIHAETTRRISKPADQEIARPS